MHLQSLEVCTFEPLLSQVLADWPTNEPLPIPVHQVSLLLVGVTSWVGPVLITSLVRVFWSVLVVMLGCAPDADDPPRRRLEGVVSSPAVCPAQFFQKLQLGITDDTGPVQHASHSWILGRVSFNSTNHWTQTSRLSTGLHFSSDMLRCELAVAPVQFSGTGTQDNLR